ncbi:zinc-binding dehydrogenase [Peribacillus psychrosaccharolyticus]|uniref:Zinc-binding dehydrogenase n=1 Tax=Peribacillus psychrosaccharolyticus TaxID=1407 RepID=A0A974NKH3_PERPY|nr:zinc-binding alcohol dehydrogenase family protein [Peribacillus psychrosaccharolyticus]MEC2054752.1 zinc-binding alcohol dehydrogenase family protein [Peribacillus psychrosaccharolyticus]MED3744021.1 zinc-binding alcohol dehydrogenase family protein [Peribacillus psychrosaccharolyticus]QQS99521.1 zinc-binding dehydrogenase [Peribacillus psychrosaccharolyticus]
MKAVVLEKPCRADELVVQEVPIPTVKPGWILIKVKAFGINRSEIFTRQGDSPSVKLPRIIGIECVGEIEDPSDSSFQKGQRVVSLMGGLGREFDGSYAEYALIPTSQAYPIDNDMDWVELAAIPEMYYTAYASLFDALQLKKGETLLIRGGSSSVGLAALQLAKSVGATVISTTRNTNKMEFLKEYGADFVLLDDESFSEQLFSFFPNGVNKVLELVGTTTLKHSLKLLSEHGILCMTGILGGEWLLENFEPMMDIPSGTYFTQFDSGANFKEKLLIELFDHIEQHKINVPIAKVFPLDEIDKAHLLMESNVANGKIVVVNS